MVKEEKIKGKKSISGIFYRYTLLLVLAIMFSFTDFPYIILLKLTIYPISFILNLFLKTIIIDDYIFINNLSIQLIPACIAVSAYLLLIILNLTTSMSAIKRLKTLVFSLASLLIINIIRIIALIFLIINDYPNFEVIHKFLWYFLSIFFVLAIWFVTAYIFKITNIPIYSDIKKIIKLIIKH